MTTILRMSVLSTGSVRIRPEHARRTATPFPVWLFTSRRWSAPRPINVYVIEHERGLVLFDTGQDRRSVTDPDYFPRGLLGLAFRRLATFAISPTETLTARLGELGYSPDDVQLAVLSHLHQDHIGGLSELAGAEIVVSAREWEASRSRLAAVNGILLDHIDLPGLRWKFVTPSPTSDASLAPFTSGHDLFGDGSLVLLPTPGHTPGSLSLLVRQEGIPPLLLIGDLSYDIQSLEDGAVPGVGGRGGLDASTRAVNQLRSRWPDLVVLAAHDPAAAGMLRAALDSTSEK